MGIANENRRFRHNGAKGLLRHPASKVDCPQCSAKAGERCWNAGLGARFHKGRYLRAGITWETFDHHEPLPGPFDDPEAELRRQRAVNTLKRIFHVV